MLQMLVFMLHIKAELWMTAIERKLMVNFGEIYKQRENNQIERENGD